MTWLDDDADDELEGEAAAGAARADPIALLPTGPTAAARSIVTIYGKSGFGKTTHAASIYRSAIARGVCGTWLDTTGNNLYLARAGHELGVHCAVAQTVDGWAAHVRTALRQGKPYNIVLDRPGTIAPLWRLVMSAGHMLLAVDEFDEYVTANTILREGHPLRRLFGQGRQRQVSIISTVRVPSDAHNLLRSQTDVCISFRQEDPKVADLIASEMFKSSDRRAAGWLLRLPEFCYLRYNRNTEKLSWGRAPRPGA